MRKIFFTFILVILADQILKLYIKLNFFEGITAGKTIIPGVLELAFVENPGMAFGWELPGGWGKIILTVFRIIAAFVIFWYVRKLVFQKAHSGLVICISLILAGAVGNIIDSIFYGVFFSESDYNTVATVMSSPDWSQLLKGHVVDMFHFTLTWPEGMSSLGGREIFPPIFNIADAAISAGVILILIRQKSFFNHGNIFHKKDQEQLSEEQNIHPENNNSDSEPEISK